MSKRRNLDLNQITKGWEYNPNRITARIIRGMDGKKKVQMRVDIGVLQMELSGRPDGKRPYGYESLLEYYKKKIDGLKKRKRGDKFFTLTRNNCNDLRLEAIQYYYRYMALYNLGRYNDVIRDTNHNLEIIKLTEKYAEDEDDYLYFRQFYPMIIFMNTKAKVARMLEMKRQLKAIEIIDSAVDLINHFLSESELEEYKDKTPELMSLHELRENILSNKEEGRSGDIKPSEYDRLNRRLKVAIALENYEEAALIRDKLKLLKEQK